MNDFNYIKNILDSNGVIGFPTETVYGIGALSVEGISKIFSIKNRSLDKPCCLYLYDIKDVLPYLKPSFYLQVLTEAFWPGPLTIIVSVLHSFPYVHYHGTIGLRMPALLETLELLKHVGPFLGTSANVSGELPLCSYDEVTKTFGDKLDYIVPTSAEPSKVPSTVISIQEDKLQLLREGSLLYSDILKTCGAVAQ